MDLECISVNAFIEFLVKSDVFLVDRDQIIFKIISAEFETICFPFSSKLVGGR